MQIDYLYILTPLSNQSPVSLAEIDTVKTNDLIADFRRFPVSIWQIQNDRTCTDITSNLFTPPDYWTVAREWLVTVTKQTGLQDILSINGYGFWWTLNGQKFVPGLSTFGNIFAWIDLLNEARKQHTFKKIIIYGHHKEIIYLTQQIFHTTKVQIHTTPPIQTKIQTLPPRRIGLLLVRIIVSLIYFIYSFMRRPDICFFSSTSLLRETTSGARLQLHDVYLGDIARKIHSRGWYTTIVEKYTWNASWRSLKARGFFFPSDLIFLLSSPKLSKLGIHRKSVKNWHQKWQNTKPKIIQHLHYQGYNLAPLLIPMIRQEFTHHGPNLEIMTKLWYYILSIWQPKLIYINNSYSRATVPAIIASKSLGIPTIEQQHGVIGRNHIAYLTPNHLKTTTKFPLCDTMVVWGKHTKQFLVNAKVYQPNQVFICGFPRIDSLLKNLPPKSKTLRELNIPHNAQIALYTSNGFAQGYMHEILDSILQIEDTSDIYWIIKLHPQEKTKHIWQTEIKRRQLHTVRVVGEEFNFYALLAACDIHISFASTTLIESAILGKPNLGLDISHTSDPAGYAQADAFLPVAPEQLGTSTHSILHNSEHKNSLLNKQKEFANNWCLHDGKAVERIVHLIEEKYLLC